MQTVIETTAYLISAKEEGISPEELFDIVSFIAANPNAGDLMQGTGGARKVRFPTKHKGKSGGYRIITFFGGKDIPVFLLDVYSKSSQGNLTKAERNELKWILTALLDEYKKEK
ncbi:MULTISPECIES: type II toxin-antitoxin system RelE/ParE family toxin [unclassified Bartonella]|uniref:type II toxin-antitoxin system RelE/ParE family toxin n=1 Tax=unclassified Bartonella TaxID=2645622 RepID=UPI0035CF251E